MQWSEEIDMPHQFTFNLEEYSGTRNLLDKATQKLVLTCSFKNAVYIVFRNNVPQYVGQSGNVGQRFIAGVNKSHNGYVWPQPGGTFTTYFFEVPSAEHFRKAIEMEVMLLLRLYTGFWPIESSGANPFHQLKSTAEINMASTRAREILNWLCTINPKFQPTLKETPSMLDAFYKAEARLGR